MKIRRVVSGRDSRGRAVVVSDELVEGGRQGNMGGVPVWGGDAAPRLPSDGASPGQLALFPRPGGWRFSILVVYPDAAASPDMLGSEAAELAELIEVDHPGMHTTDTVDVEVVLSGEPSIELDDGKVVTLKPGDCFVQNGTRHRWFNTGSEPAVLGVSMIGATRE